MAARQLVCSLFVVLGLALVAGYPTGAPDNWCARWVPAHGQRGRGTPGYRIVVGNGNGQLKYGPNGHDHLNVTISNMNAGHGRTQTFKGFFIQAIQNTIPLNHPRRQTFGTFTNTSSEAKPVWCEGGWMVQERISGASHTSRTPKNDITVVWNAPRQDVGSVQLVATVVLDYLTYWVDIRSAEITPAFPATGGNGHGQGQGQGQGQGHGHGQGQGQGQQGQQGQQQPGAQPPTLGLNRVFQISTNNPGNWLANMLQGTPVQPGMAGMPGMLQGQGLMQWAMPGPNTGIMMTPGQQRVQQRRQQQFPGFF